MGGRIAILLALILCSTGYAEEAVEIPLSDIWALNSRGTKDLTSLLKDEKGNYIEREPRRQFNIARTALLKKLPEREATKLFVVSGTGRVALAATAEQLRDEMRQGIEPLPTSEEISLVFFSYVSAYRVRIEQVERQGNVFRIEYRFVPPFTAEASIQLAIIPIGKLPVGHYPVELVQLPVEKKYLYKGFQPVSEEEAKRIVSRPYTFQVYERPAPDPGPAKDAVVIPLDEIWALDMLGTKDVRELTSKPYAPLSIGSQELLQLIGKEKAGPGYVVPGTGRDALIAARKELPSGEAPPNELPQGTDVSIIFYSHAYSPRIVLHRVERQGNTINIRYRFDGTGETYMPSNFALIPLGKLPAGPYKVNMIPVWDKIVEMSPSYYLQNFDDVPRVVSQSFKFTITPPGDE